MAADPLTKSTVDGLFNDDFSDFGDDPFADKPTTKDTRDDKPVLSPRAGLKRKVGDDNLGLDEEVKIVKKRKPVAKLDEARLLSEPGIPKLRSITRSGQLSKRLRIRGKGHEFTDVARLLNHFQLWLDDLYPRAKFADALQLVEKAGHTKRMHIMRTEWINEGKPGYKSYDNIPAADEIQAEPDLFGDAHTQAKSNGSHSAQSDVRAQQSHSIFGGGHDGDETLFIPDANRSVQNIEDNAPDDDELDALLAAQDEPASTRVPTSQPRPAEESEGEDDLDALLAERDSLQRRLTTSSKTPAEPNTAKEVGTESEDGLDALLAEHEAESSSRSVQYRKTDDEQPPTQHDFEDDDSDDDLEALLRMQRTRTKSAQDISEPTLPTPQHTSSPSKPISSPLHVLEEPATTNTSGQMFSSSPIPNNPEDVDLDDLDAMLASQEEKTTAGVQSKQETTPKVKKVMDAMEALLSSPILNTDSR